MSNTNWSETEKALDASADKHFAWVSDGKGNPGKHGDTQQFQSIRQSIKLSRNFAIVFLILLICLVLFDFYIQSSICTLDIKWLAPPLAILLSISVALYIGLVQLKSHLHRAQVDHATRLADSAPDLIDCSTGFKDLCEHLHENAQHYDNKATSRLNKSSSWQRCHAELKLLAKRNPSCLAELASKLRVDSTHGAAQNNVLRVLAFFEKAAISIRYGYSDESVLWERYNAAALDSYIRATPLVISAYVAHERSIYHGTAQCLGLPYEHYESWLYWRTKGDAAVKDLLIELRTIREMVTNHILQEERRTADWI